MDDQPDLAAVWDRVRQRLNDDSSMGHQQRAWVRMTRPMGLMENTALLSAPNDFAKRFLERDLGATLSRALGEELRREISVAITVQPEPAEPTAEETAADDLDGFDPDDIDVFVDPASGARSTTGPLSAPDGVDGWDPGGRHRAGAAPAPYPRSVEALSERETRLNQKYTFDTFVIGAGNRFTHAAAVAVAEAPAKAYNPLFIYGDSGLGKTHLLHAIGHYAQHLMPGLRTRYVSSEEFTNEFINSVRDDKMQNFQDRYRSVDLLLIDDIQFLERAERTQEEFFHTFNTLHNANKQIVISSDKPPRQMSTLEDRLRTRFEWGLISDVQAPDLETRIAILRKKAASDGITPPPDVLEFIASRIQTNIRELEGALIRVTAFASLNRQAVDMNLTEQVLRDLVGVTDAAEISATDIMAVTAEYFTISIDDLTGASRSRGIVNARQMAMYLCRELTQLSLPKIGEKFGGRDHTTVMHADRKIRQQMKEKMTVYNQIAELTARIRGRARS